MMFICPVCREAFQRYGNSYKCRNGHCFDIAKQGYVNLLTGSKGGNHGDNRLMTSARRAFLNKGYYDRFISRYKGYSIGVCYKEFMTDEIPTDEYDKPVDTVITDR